MFHNQVFLSIIFISLSTSAQVAPGPIKCLCPQKEKFVCCKSQSRGIYTAKNSCECNCTGKIISNGKCLPSPSPFTTPNPRSCICPEIFDPVCCKRKSDGSLFTASNSCFCECEGKVVAKGECPSPKPSPSPDFCICPLLFKPVCCKKDDGTVKTESNACFCRCDGKVISNKPCPVKETPTPRPTPCICPLFFDPVCCANAAGDLVTKSNSCFCGCDGGTVAGGAACEEEMSPSPLPRSCICPLFVEPICCEDDAGNLVTKSNSCFCGCAAGTLSGGTACLKKLA